jgi:hypothetical protein
MKEVVKLIAWVCLGAAFSGCQTVRESTPPRTLTEQLLLSAAISNAVADQRFTWLEGKKTYVEDKYFESYDKGFAVGTIREQIAASGALLVKSHAEAEVVLEIRSAALSMDNSDTLLGLPAMSLPIVLTGVPIQTPEIALYKSQKANTLSKFALFAYKRASGQYLRSVNPMLGQSYLRLYKIIFFSWQKTDVPELSRKHKPRENPSGAKSTP